MKNVIEMYLGIWVIMILLYLCLAFTSINMNVVQARNILNTVKEEVRASNGGVLKDNLTYTVKSKDKGVTLANNGYSFEYKITKQSLYTDKNGNSILAVSNFSSVAQKNYKIGVPAKGVYEEVFTTDSKIYGGGGVTNGKVRTKAGKMHGNEQYLSLEIPAFSTMYLYKKAKKINNKTLEESK